LDRFGVGGEVDEEVGGGSTAGDAGVGQHLRQQRDRRRPDPVCGVERRVAQPLVAGAQESPQQGKGAPRRVGEFRHRCRADVRVARGQALGPLARQLGLGRHPSGGRGAGRRAGAEHQHQRREDRQGPVTGE